MSLTDYTLDKEFDIFATWFKRGDTYEDGVKGKLHYSNTSIVLDLYDSLSNRFSDESKEISCIYGYSTNGHFLVLNHYTQLSEETSSLGFAIESYSVDTFYLFDDTSEVLIEQPPTQVKKIQFSLKHLHNWLNTEGVDPFVDLENSAKHCYTVQSEGLIVSTGVSHRRKSKQKRVVLEEEYFLELVKQNNETKSLASFLKDASLIQKLIEFLNSAPQEFTYIEFICTNRKGRYFFKQIERQLPRLPEHSLFLTQIEKQFSSILDSWFQKADQFALIIDNYLNDLYLDYYIETKLVNSIRNLEIYYRNFVRDPKYIEKRRESLKADQELLLECVELKVSEKNKKHFTQNILYVGEESLRVKLNELIGNLPEALFAACIQQEDKSPSKSRTSLINKLIDTRNFYTHGDEAEKYPDRLTDSKDFFLFNEKLKRIQRYYIYKELGLPKDLLLAILLPEAKNF